MNLLTVGVALLTLYVVATIGAWLIRKIWAIAVTLFNTAGAVLIIILATMLAIVIAG